MSATSTRCSSAARRGSWSCARSPRQATPRPPHGRCGTRWRVVSAQDTEPPGEDGAADERRVSQPEVVESDARAGMERGYARSRARTEAIQAQLEPLGPGERPL